MLPLSRPWATDVCRLVVRTLFGALLFALLPATAVRADELQDVAKLVKGGQLDDAERRADLYLKINPKDAQMRFLKGVILSQRGKRDEAIAVFTGLTQDFPELAEPYNNLAVIYAAQGQYDKAREALESAVRVAPNDATAHENLGDVYAALAARSYRDARRYDANDAAALRKLDAIRALLANGPVPATSPTTPDPAPTSSATPDPRAQRNVGLASPAAPSTLRAFPSAQAPEIVIPSVGTSVPPGSNVVGVGAPEAAEAGATAPLTGVETKIPPDPANPVPAITAAVNRWAASKKVKTGAINIRVDGDTAVARFREEDHNARRSVARNRALTLKRGDGGWSVTDAKVES
jgi:hypothetical protein